MEPVTNEQLQHIRNVIQEQFGAELTYKEGELENIEDRIRLAKLMLQRLRLGVLAQHYGVAGFYPTALDFSEENVGVQSSWESFECEFLKRPSQEEDVTSTGMSHGVQDEEKAVATTTYPHKPLQSVGESSSYVIGKMVREKKEFVLGPVPLRKQETVPPTSTVAKDTSQINSDTNGDVPSPLTLDQSMSMVPHPTPPPSDIHATPTPPPPPPAKVEVTRFYSKKRIVIGNTSQYLHPASVQEQGDGSTHKWMVYVRGPHEDPDISNFVKAVRFFLHPSYHPNDIIRVTRPPFHLIRLGWGEFPIRVQLEFCDRRNKPVDIIHNLVLDRTHTGQQTLGAETVVDLDINPRKVVCGPNGLSHPLINGQFATDAEIRSATALEDSKTVAEVTPLSSQSQASLKVDGREGQNDTHILRTSRESSSFSKSSDLSDSNCHLSGSSLVEASQEATPITSTPSLPVRDAPQPAPPPQVLTTNLEKCLHSAVRVVPLYGRPSGSDDFHLTACTVDQFKRWSVGRRRAAEWMRALAIKRHVERKLKLETSLLSTKQVMQWCRRNGYTLLDPCTPGGVGFCKYCGCQLELGGAGTAGVNDEGKLEESSRKVGQLHVHEHCREMYEGMSDPTDGQSFVDMEVEGSGIEQTTGPEALTSSTSSSFQPLSSLSESEKLFSSLIASQNQLERQETARIEDKEVDVETQPGCTSARARAYEHPVPRLRVPQTPELKWVQQTAASIGIHIYPAVIDRMYAHVVEHMVYMSCTRFLKAVLTQSLQEAGRRLEGDLSSERVLTPLHVYQAIQSLDQCDFLTNKHLGLEAKKPNKVGGVSDPDLSSSCSSSDDEG